MKPTKIFCLCLMASLTLAPVSWAQAPAIPGAPAGVAAPAGAPAAPAAPGNIWSMICPTADQKAACKNCFCNSPIGKLMSGGAGPMTMISGGLLPNCCAQNSLANDLKKSAESPEGAAAKVKADEADAKARAAAIRYLANVDCERWPEATETLKNALRKDRNECVRLEAALALRNGCCCNNQTIDALKNCVLGENKTDPNPVERSERVRTVAAEALARCVMSQPVEDPREKVQKTEAPPAPDPADYYKKIASMPRDQVVAGARAALVSMQKPVKAQTTGQKTDGAPPVTTGSAAPSAAVAAPNAQHANSISGIVANAFAPGGEQSRQPFFSGLTKTLTGKQDNPAPARQEPVPASPERAVRMPEPAPATPLTPLPSPPEYRGRGEKVIPTEIPPPAAPPSVPIPRLPPDIKPVLPPVSDPEIKPVLPRISVIPALSSETTSDWPQESKKASMQILRFRPTNDFRLGAPVEAKAAAAIEVLQPVPAVEPSASEPRESVGVVTIDEVPAQRR